MKTPYRYLIGIAVGLIAGFLLPATEAITGVVDILAELSLRLGRYMVLPLVFFSLPVAVTRLRREGVLGTVLSRTALYALATSAALTAIGTLFAWLVGFGRIAVIPGTAPEIEVVRLMDLLRRILTFNSFGALVGDPSFLLPLVLPAFLIGWHLHHDREIAEPTFNLFDSVSRILYRINSYFLILMPGLLAVLTVSTTLEARAVVEFRRFLPMAGVLLGVAVVLIGGIYPLVLWLSGNRRSPWKDLAGMSGALLGAMVSGSPLFNYGNLTRHLKENLNVRRNTAALAAPAYLMFARGGTALIASFAMLTIVRSYSSLEITLFQAAWTALFSFLISFALPATPQGGLVAALMILGGLYGRGLDDGWLILVPVLPVLGMIATVIDTATGAVLILIINRRAGLEEPDMVSGVRF